MIEYKALSRTWILGDMMIMNLGVTYSEAPIDRGKQSCRESTLSLREPGPLSPSRANPLALGYENFGSDSLLGV